MNNSYLSRKFSRFIAPGLAALLIPVAAAPALGQINSDSDTGNLGMTGSEASGIAQVITVISSLRYGVNNSQSLSSQISLAVVTTIQTTQEVQQSAASDGEANEAIALALDELELEVTTTLLQSRGRRVFLRTGVNVSPQQFARAFATVSTFVFPKQASNIFEQLATPLVRASEDSTTGVTVASSQPLPLIAQEFNAQLPEDAVEMLYQTFNDAFSVAGVDAETSRENAQKLVIALASLKTWFLTDDEIEVGAVNKTTRLMEPVLKVLPEFREVLDNNPTANDYALILDTMTVIDAVVTPLQAVNDAI